MGPEGSGKYLQELGAALGTALSDQVQPLVQLSQIRYSTWYSSLSSGAALGTTLSDQVQPLVQLS
jgi:hypothetical protein